MLLRNEPIIAFGRSPNPLRDQPPVESIALTGGRVPVPQRLGFGITVDESVLKECERGGSGGESGN